MFQKKEEEKRKMLIKYVGARKSANIVCSGRATYYFGPENDYVVEVTNMKHVTQILKSILHRCEVVDRRPEKPKVEKPRTPEAPKTPEKPKAPAKKKPKKGRKAKK